VQIDEQRLKLTAQVRALLQRSLFWLNVFKCLKAITLPSWLSLVLSAVVDTSIYFLSAGKLNSSPRPLGDSTIYATEYDTFYFIRGGTDDLYNVLPHREDDVHDFIVSALKKGDVFIDVGANIGYYTVLGAKKVGAKGLVLAIEPVLQTMNILKTNIRLNRLSNVHVIGKAAWRTRERLQLSVPKELYGGASLVKHCGNKLIAVDGVPIDEVCADVSNIKLMKLDVEGAEYEVLQGSNDSLLRTQLLVTEVSRDAEDILDILKDRGFECRKCKFSTYILCKNTVFGRALP